MTVLKRIFFITLALSIMPIIVLSASTDETLPKVDIISVRDFSQLARIAKNQQKLIMLEFSASYCSYCVQLEEEIIKPMLLSGDYDADVLIRKVDIDGFAQLRDFDGTPISVSALAKQFGVELTPTLVFLDSDKREVSKRIVGVNSLDFFSAYVDDAIEHGLTVIR